MFPSLTHEQQAQGDKIKRQKGAEVTVRKQPSGPGGTVDKYSMLRNTR